jgi:putative peptide zinc metalloprotease protein
VALFSNHWHRVAAWRPRLAAQVRVTRQPVRGETWYVLADPLTGRSVRLNRVAYEVVGRFDGTRSVQAVWDDRHAAALEPPTQDEVVELLARLGEQGLIDTGRAADYSALRAHRDEGERKRLARGLLSWRVPLGNPSAWLDRLRALQRLLFTRGVALAWVVAVVWLGATALAQAPALWAYAHDWALTPGFAVLAMAMYVPIKFVHEGAHALAVRRFGGEVREAGVTLMLLMPMPYVDASAASSWPERRLRMLVSAVGIMAELAVAAVALAVWLAVDEGLARRAAFAALTIGGVSTLLFNANPLMRLDGYYLLCDAASLPNLATRSRELWLDVLRRRLLRLPEVEPMPTAAGERPWLVAYAPLAWLNLMVVTTLAVMWLGAMSAVLGAVAAVAVAVQVVLVPVWRLWTALQREAHAQEASARRLRHGVAVALGALATALLVPMPQHTVAPAVVWPADDAQLRADTDAFVAEVHAADGAAVNAGDLVLTLVNPRLAAEHERHASRVRALEHELIGSAAVAAQSAGEKSGNLQAELEAARAALARTDERVRALEVRAAVAGRLALPDADDLPGQYVQQGRLLGQVLTGEAPRLRVAVPEDRALHLRRQARGVSAWLADAAQPTGDATLLRDSVGAVDRLPSAALSERFGGDVLTDPADEQHLRTLQPVVLMDVQLGASTVVATQRLGARAWVRFDEGWEPLAWRLAGELPRQWLRRAHPNG